MNTDRLWDTRQAAEYCGLSPGWFPKARLTGGGPPYIKIGSRVLYDPADVKAWLEAKKHKSTSEYEVTQ